MSAVNIRATRPLLQIAVLALALAGTAPALATEGAVLWVSNHGIDTSTCGTTTRNACRSISQGIENATDGDTLAVLPGQYGDLNADGDLDDPGEEHFDPGVSDRRTCVVCVTKRLRIYSEQGADVTIISVQKIRNAIFPAQVTVNILASGVTFGAKGHGFTITGPSDLALFASGIGNVQIAGNTTIGGEYRLEPAHGFLRVSDNRAVRGHFQLGAGNIGGYVVVIDPGDAMTEVVLRNNSASGTPFIAFYNNAIPFQVLDNIATDNDNRFGGFYIFGTRTLLRGNTSIGNTTGFQLIPSGSTPSATVIRNRASGNRGPGIVVSSGLTDVEIHENNIFGNDTNGADVLDPPHTGRNCGLLATGGFGPEPPIDATNNFWGSSTGPGVDGADNVGFAAGCDPARRVSFKPFAVGPFPIGPFN